jgi:carbonic anhydrase/acetyltransferase-like protein (isoleucine patch superfamily)
MPKIIKFKSLTPKIDKTAFIAAGAIIAGDVRIAENAGIWFNCVLRGDVAPIRVGACTNIQDGTIVHTSRFDGPTNIGSNITIGHLALIHACTIRDNAFIGMQSTIMDKAIIEEYAFIAAGSLVTPGKVVKSRELWAGSPAKFIRKITEAEVDFMRDNIENYMNLAQGYM